MILIIDGHSLAFSAYYAVPPLTNKNGFPTGVIHTFLNIILNLKEQFKPDRVIVTFDSKGKGKRHEIFSEYKANRESTPEDLILQVEKLKDIIPKMGITMLAVDSTEADDIIYTLTKKFENEECIIVTKDKDLYQMVDERVKLFDYKKNKIIDTDEVINKFEIRPAQILDYLALTGDTSDNIPGVKGIGPKTAVKLLKEFGDLDKIYENLGKLKGSVKNKLENGKENAYLSKKLATLEFVNNLKIENRKTDLESLEIEIKNLELKSIYNRLFSNQNTENEESFSITAGVVENPIVAVYSNGAFYIANNKYFQETKEIYGLGVQFFYDYKDFLKKGCEFKSNVFDLQIVSWLNNPDSGGLKRSKDESIESFLLKIVTDVENQMELLNQNGLQSVYFNLEHPFIKTLAEMELAGVKFSPKIIRKVDSELDILIKTTEEKIFEITGEHFNLNSTKQLAEVLFEKMKLKPSKKIKTGYSTSEEALKGVCILNPEYSELISLILSHREYRKLKTTYTLTLIDEINEKTGRIHSEFKQTGTATGRLSSQNPNMQNLPQKGEIAKKIKSAFIAEKGFKFISFDYSQIELRILAHLSKDKHLIEAYLENKDIHSITAKKILGISDSEITEEIRRIAKAVNFGVLYGLSPFGLSRDTGITLAESKKFIEEYYNVYSGVKEYFERHIKFVKENGFTETLLGRKRFIKDINSKNKMVRQRAERMALNAPIQGSAADVIKLAMIKTLDFIINNQINAKLILQVHDELIFEVENKFVDDFFNDIKSIMENVIRLDVPLTVNGKIGNHFGELK
jgi:DNA polymerase-1